MEVACYIVFSNPPNPPYQGGIRKPHHPLFSRSVSRPENLPVSVAEGSAKTLTFSACSTNALNPANTPRENRQPRQRFFPVKCLCLLCLVGLACVPKKDKQTQSTLISFACRLCQDTLFLTDHRAEGSKGLIGDSGAFLFGVFVKLSI